MGTMAIFETLTTLSCFKCGIMFALPGSFENTLRETHRDFYCPNGHIQHFVGKTEAEQLREQLATKEREVAAAKSRAEKEAEWRHVAEECAAKAVRSRDAYRGVTTRMKRKIAKGLCPCCTRRFNDLAAHIKTEHPKWDPDAEATAVESKLPIPEVPKRVQQ